MKHHRLIAACSISAIAAATAFTLIREEPASKQVCATPMRNIGGKSTRERKNPGSTHVAFTPAGDRRAVSALSIESPDGGSAVALEKVRHESMRTLDRLTEKLGLSQTQRRLVLPSLVAASRDFRPDMIVAGKPVPQGGAAIEDAICEVLDDDQRALYQESLLDDAAWWDNALAQLTANDEPDDPDDPDSENP